MTAIKCRQPHGRLVENSLNNPTCPAPIGCGVRPMKNCLLHQKHLTGAFDGRAKAALVVRRKSGVFPGQNTTLIGHILLEKIHIFIVQGVHGEIHLGFRTRLAHFRKRAAASAACAGLGFVVMSFAWHRILLDFPVQRVTPKETIILHDLDFLRLELLVASGLIARRGFTLFARFRAFNRYYFSRHK